MSQIIAFFAEYAHIVINKVKSVALFHINGLEGFVNDHGHFAVAIAMLISLALIVFAATSFKSYKVLLPLGAIVLGAWGASKFCPRVLEALAEKVSYLNFIETIGNYIDYRYLSGIIAAVILALICLKHTKCSTTIIGVGFGYFVVLRFAQVFFRTSDIFRLIVEASGASRVIPMFYTVLAHVCMLVSAYIFYKWFKTLYILGVSTFASACAFGIITFFATRVTTHTFKFTLIACAIGAVVGLILALIQLKKHKNDYNELACPRCEKQRKIKAAKKAKMIKEAKAAKKAAKASKKNNKATKADKKAAKASKKASKKAAPAEAEAAA